MSDKFVREFFVALDFEGHDLVVPYEICHPDAKVSHVVLRKEYDEHGRLSKEFIALLVRDAGSLRADKQLVRSVVVVRRVNDLTALPESCGKLLGYVQPSVGRFAYYVFDSTARPQPLHSKGEETTSPARVSTDSTESFCACVIDGTMVHETGTDVPSGTFSTVDTNDWFESPSVAKAS